MGTRKKRLEEVVLGIQVAKDRTFHLPVLVDEDLDINLNIDYFGEVKKNLKNPTYKLAFADNGSDQVRVHGLIGVDIIQFMDMKMIKCMNRIAWEFPTGMAPLGNSHHFLYQEQIARARARKSAPENNYQTIITDYSSCPKEQVNSVLNPQKTYPNAFSECLNERTQDARYAKKKKKIKFKSQEIYRGIWLPILNNYNTSPFSWLSPQAGMCRNFVKELVILFHRTSAAPWGHVASIIKKSSTGDSSSYFLSHRC